MEHKSGFINIIGKPNVGKSTLLNQLMGEKLSIVTSKAQTTRQRVYGIVNEDDYQIIFSDTPGIIADPAYIMQEKMNGYVKDALKDGDIFLMLVEPGDEKNPSELLINKLNHTSKPVILIINKIDLLNQEELETLTEAWHEKLPNAEILPISAINNINTEYILPKIKSLLPVSPPFFDKDAWTNQSQRFFVNEAVREKILLNYQKEIPYSVEIVTESFKEEEDLIKIESIIYVERNSQKGIIIGHKGEKLREVHIAAMKDLEQFFGKKIDLNLFVKVKKDWRKNERDLKNFGY